MKQHRHRQHKFSTVDVGGSFYIKDNANKVNKVKIKN